MSIQNNPPPPVMSDPRTLTKTKIASVELYYDLISKQAWTVDGAYIGPWNAVVNTYDLETYGGPGRIIPQS